MTVSGPERDGDSIVEMWIVDHLQGGVAVLVEATDEDDAAVIEVAAALLGPHAIEGAVLIVPLGDVGEPVWEDAQRAED